MTLSIPPVVAAAGEAPAFFSEVALLLGAAALVAYVCNRLRIMPIVSFLVAGALIGPHALGLIRDEALIEAAAEVGVVLLLFTIGIEFSLTRLARIKRLIFVGGGLQVGLVIAAVTGLLALFGVDWQAGVFTGFLVALSSTAIVMKLLMDRGATNSESGQAGLGLLIFQDLAIVAMVLMVPILAGEGGTAGAMALAFGKAIGIVVLVIVVARRLMPKILEAVARACSQEIFLLTVVAICFVTAWLTSLAGVSLSLGAFLAGLMVSESRFSELAFGEILPLQILFSAAFFVSVGLLLDLGFVMANPLLVLAVIAGVLALKFLTTGLSLRLLGYGTGTTVATGLMLAQAGEFSFVLERAGREVGLYPAGLEAGGPEAFIAATVVLMIATPYLADLGEWFKARTVARATSQAGAAGAGGSAAAEGAAAGAEGAGGAAVSLRDHVIVAGYGEAGRRLAGALDARGIPYLILTLSPEGAREAEADGRPVLRGNYTRQHELTLGAAREARMLIVADDDLEMTRRVVSAAQALRQDLRVVARTRFTSEIEELREAGASVVVAEEQEGVTRVLAEVLEAYGVDPATIRAHEAEVRGGGDAGGGRPGATSSAPEDAVALTDRQRATTRCSHVNQTRAVVPSAAGCEECLKIGDSWVHLRICMSCGKVGCCDSSRNKHASRHAREADHPVVKSFQPGEDWAWCYVDEAYLG